jgi:hypothetical protein
MGALHPNGIKLADVQEQDAPQVEAVGCEQSYQTALSECFL